METLRRKSVRSSSMRELHCTHKMWLGAFCFIIFSGDVGMCIRSLDEDTPVILIDQADPVAVTGVGKSLSRTSKKPVNEQLSVELDRKLPGEFRCQRDDLKISSDITRYLPDGMPIYSVEIANTCIDCSLTDIHVSCGEWASVTLVNPQLFRRVMEGDCLVNNGTALEPQDIVFFEYSNSFPYTFSATGATPVCI